MNPGLAVAIVALSALVQDVYSLTLLAHEHRKGKRHTFHTLQQWVDEQDHHKYHKHQHKSDASAEVEVEYAAEVDEGLAEESAEEFEIASGVGASVAMTSDGYLEVAGSKDDLQMLAFTTRIVDKYHGVISDRGGLAGWIPFHSGTNDAEPSTFQSYMNDLSMAAWLQGFQDCSKQPLDDKGYEAVADMINDDQMRGYIRRVIDAYGGEIRDVEGDPHLFEMAPQYSGTQKTQKYEKLIKELQHSDWVKGMGNNKLEEKTKVVQASTQCADSVKDPLLFIGVNSAPNNFERRMEVRNSWMKDQILKQDENGMSAVKAKFVVGKFMDEDTRLKVEEEHRHYGDILFLDVEEGYDNLNKKSVAYFRWFAVNFCCSEDYAPYAYAMKLDDDSWPNLGLLLPYLNKKKDETNQLQYIGALLWHGAVLRDGKNAETAELQDFPYNTYPAYAAGSGYILSMGVTRAMDDHVKEKGDIQLLKNEDTTIGYWIFQENYMNMAVTYDDLNHQESGCSDGLYIAMNLCPGELHCMWSRRLTGEAQGENHQEDMCCHYKKKNHCELE